LALANISKVLYFLEALIYCCVFRIEFEEESDSLFVTIIVVRLKFKCFLQVTTSLHNKYTYTLVNCASFKITGRLYNYNPN